MEYLRFAAIHRNVQIKDLEGQIEGFADARIADEDTFSLDEVRELVASLKETVRADVYHDLQRMAHSTVVLLRQCMQQAEQNGIQLTLNTGLLEDEKFLLEAQRLEEESERAQGPGVLAPSTTIGDSKSLMKLPGLESAKTAEALAADNAVLKQRLADLQQELVEANREKTSIRDRLAAAENAGEQASSAAREANDGLPALFPHGSGAGSSSGLRKAPPVGDGGGGVQELTSELEELREQMQLKVQQTPQFKALNQMLQKKNEEIKMMRQALLERGWTDPHADD